MRMLSESSMPQITANSIYGALLIKKDDHGTYSLMCVMYFYLFHVRYNNDSYIAAAGCPGVWVWPIVEQVGKKVSTSCCLSQA